MGDKSNIEWTDATWNPIVGCSIVSPGCTNCYAMQMAARIESMFDGTKGATHYRGTTKKVNGNAVWTGKVALAPDHILTAPLRWKQPRKIFVNSMGDLFHESIPDADIDRVFAVMALCPQHTFQVLTKRAERMRDYLSNPAWYGRASLRVNDNPACEREEKYRNNGYEARRALSHHVPLPNVWLGVSCERQQEADERIPLLLQTPATIRFISAEPLLGPIDLTRVATESVICDERYKVWIDALAGLSRSDHPACAEDDPIAHAKVDWIIVGGESGHNARPMHPQWARDIQKACEAAGVAFFFKQWGGWWPDCGPPSDGRDRIFEGGGPCAAWTGDGWRIEKDGFVMPLDAGPDHDWMYRVGKKAAGRLLDGVEHSEFPQVRA